MVPNKKITVLIAIGKPLLAEAIANAIMSSPDLVVVAKFSNKIGKTGLITKICSQQADIAIIDINLVNPSFTQTIQKIKQLHSSMAIIITSNKWTPSCVLHSYNAGVIGYLPETANAGEVIAVVHAARMNQAVLPYDIFRSLTKFLAQGTSVLNTSDGCVQLSFKELQVLNLTAKALTNKEIAEVLSISPRTVQSHLSAIFTKLKARSRTEAALIATKNGWLDDYESPTSHID